mgnify:CR=1 FL=1
MSLERQVVDRGADAGCAIGMQRALGEEHVVMHVELGQIGADHAHHRIDGALLDDRHPVVFRHLVQLDAEFLGQRLTDGHEIVARIKAGRDLADILTQRFAVAQEHRTGEHIDLCAGIVDVIFLGHVIAGKGEQVGQRVTDHGAAAMADMHRAGRIGRHIFDIDLVALAERRTAKIRSFADDGRQQALPIFGRQTDIDEARTGDANLCDIRILLQLLADDVGQRARVRAKALGKHHGGIGRGIAMAGIARRLDDDTAEIEAVALFANAVDLLQGGLNSGFEIGE